jgi:hypothetical protein
MRSHPALAQRPTDVMHCACRGGVIILLTSKRAADELTDQELQR